MEDGGDLTEQRRKKRKRLEEAGCEPYGRRFDSTHSVGYLEKEFPEAGSEPAEEVKIAGRVMRLRRHGKAGFADIQDWSGRIQIYVREDSLPGAEYKNYEEVDIGDIIGVEGGIFRTRTGELTVKVRSFTMLSKALRPLPEKWHGLKDVEMRYRQRYLDLIVNEKARRILMLRSRVIRIIRSYLEERGFVEVETPMLQPLPGGARGRPLATHADALDSDLYLRIAPELYLKRLLVGGLERVYELSKSFRNEGISPRHNPEFTMLEVYQAYGDYRDMMELIEGMVTEAARETLGSLQLSYQGKEMDLTPPWKRVTFGEAMEESYGIDIERTSVEELMGKLQEQGVRIEGERLSRTRLVNLLADFLSRSSPTFVIDYPVEFCPLAKKNAENPALAERFELFVGGMELANAYSELNDPESQPGP